MSYTVLTQKQPKAKNVHTCIWCGEKIVIGEKYHSESGVYDGDFQQTKWHLECNLVAVEEFKTSKECEFQAHENERPLGKLGFK